MSGTNTTSGAELSATAATTTTASSGVQQMSVEENPQLVLRAPSERPIYKLSVRLIDTYKYINKVYYEAKAQKLKGQKDSARGGVHNDGYDDQNYDYILQGDEILQDRYILKHRMGKGSFGQVVCAYDRENKCEVAIKIIKSRKPFIVQARTEIDILQKILNKDRNDESNIVRMQDQFMYRNHQCLVFEILSFNLYELLKNTKFRGVSLNLIRKFSRQLLKSLEFLNREDVNIIHCDLKPENILLRHPRRSAVKLIDFGSSCYLTKRTYSYIQSRFYRSPEVLLGLPYTQKIDLWSLGCVVVEMHTGEPLFGGTNQNDQMCRIVDILGMPPLEMIKASPEKSRTLFFEKIAADSIEGSMLPGSCDLNCKVYEEPDPATGTPGMYYVLKRPQKETPKPRKLADVIGVYTGGPNGRRKNEADHTQQKYEEFLDFASSLLKWKPTDRLAPHLLSTHPYLTNVDLPPPSGTAQNPTSASNVTSVTPPQPPATAGKTSQSQEAGKSSAPMDVYGSGNIGASAPPPPPQQAGIKQTDSSMNSGGYAGGPIKRLNSMGQGGNIATLSGGAPLGAVLGSAIDDPNFSLVDSAASNQNLGLGTSSNDANSTTAAQYSNSSSKDTNRGRRDGAPGSSKIRSQSAPGGSQSHVRLLDGKVERSNDYVVNEGKDLVDDVTMKD